MSAIATWLGRLLTGPLLESILRLWRDAQRRQLSEEQLRAELEKAIVSTIEHTAATEIEARRDVLLADLRGESALQRVWRPVVALAAFFGYWFAVIVYPFLHAWGWLPPVRFGEEGLKNMFWLTLVAVGGYMGGRTVEKVVRAWRK